MTGQHSTDSTRPLCPQDPQHYLDSHAPGGAWYGVGHDGQPSPYQPGAPTQPRHRRHIFRWVFLAIQALFLAWIIGGAVSGSGTPASCAGQMGDALRTCRDAGHAGTAIGVGLIIGLWVAVDIILALTYLIFRRRG